MDKPTRIEWYGPGYYQRERDYQGSSENGISWVGYVWRKQPYWGHFTHQVKTQSQIWHELEPRYHTDYDGSHQG